MVGIGIDELTTAAMKLDALKTLIPEDRLILLGAAALIRIINNPEPEGDDILNFILGHPMNRDNNE